MTLNPNYQICRLCGYRRNGDVKSEECPACGAPASSFVPYKVKIPFKRLRWLELDIHPIMTHFSEGGAVFIFLLYAISFIAPTLFGTNIGYGGVLDFFVIFQPIFAVLTAGSGILDGKLRYKTVKTRFLKIKIALGSGLVLTSLLVLVFHWLSEMGTIPTFTIIEGVFIILMLVEGLILGMIGSKLTCNVVPKGAVATD